MINTFLLQPGEYERDLDIKGNAIQAASLYLHKTTNVSMDVCIKFITDKINSQESIKINTLVKNKVGDRVKKVLPFDTIINKVTSGNHILTPNMVVYTNPDVELSYISGFLSDNRIIRSALKKKGFNAKVNKDEDLRIFCSNGEYNIKIENNSVSGGHSSPHNPLYLKTAHSSLTSTTRTGVSYSNAITEKLIAGNRHYYTESIILENIIAVIRLADLNKLKQVMIKYKMKVPTHQDVLDCIMLNCKCYLNYFIIPSSITLLVSNLTGLERAAFIYTGDLFQVKKHNPELINNILNELLSEPNEITEQELGYLETFNSDLICSLVSTFTADITSGIQVDTLKETNIKGYLKYYATVKHICTQLNLYKDFYDVIIFNKILPLSIFEFPSSIRRVVMGSDTDSTMWTAQDWVFWYFDNSYTPSAVLEYLNPKVFSPTADKISSFICYINSQAVLHALAMMSKQIGIPDKNLFVFSMKNEYSFKVYMRANRSKHYCSLIDAREGNIYKDPVIESKGVALKDSKMPKIIMRGLELQIKHLMSTIISGQRITVEPLLHSIANLEHLIMREINGGSLAFYSIKKMSPATAYKKPMSAVYKYHDLWTKVFIHAYGDAPTIPYTAIKMSVNLNKRQLINWLSVFDETVKTHFEEWLMDTNTNEMTQLILPVQSIEQGLPENFIAVLNHRKLIGELMAGFYILLEMLGIYVKNKDHDILLSDNLTVDLKYGLPVGIVLSQFTVKG
jgi:hypothetical protein